MHLFRMFRKPQDDDNEEYDFESRVVKAKPIDPKYAKVLGIKGRDFVRGSSQSQAEFYGQQSIEKAPSTSHQITPLSEDEKNKIHAKILKAELKGDVELVKSLKRKLDGATDGDEDHTKLLIKKDKFGNIVPATDVSMKTDKFSKGSSRMKREYEKHQSLEEMVREEKTSTAEQQLRLFERSLVKSSKIKRHDDDESVDDIAEMQKGRKREDERDERKEKQRQRREHQHLEQTLGSCNRCLESSRVPKHCVVAVGINTYLAIAEWEGLSEQHLLILPTMHVSSTIQLDENVWDEMRLWRKGLVAMWKEQDQDCIFLETAHNVKDNPHCYVEAIPTPNEAGESAPIYFHKAINESESEWADNKKLIETKDLRRQIPRGFDYFAVDFGLQNGYAHVIEDRNAFPANFGNEIIGGILDLPPKSWRNKTPMSFNDQKKRCDAVKKLWDKFDWTKRIHAEK